MTLLTAIKIESNKLKEKARLKGIYENFGQKEVQKLEGKFIDLSSYTDEMNNNRRMICMFNDWCMSYTG